MSRHTRNKLPTSFTLHQRTKNVLDALSTYYGINKTNVVEMLILDRARDTGILTGTPQVKTSPKK